MPDGIYPPSSVSSKPSSLCDFSVYFIYLLPHWKVIFLPIVSISFFHYGLSSRLSSGCWVNNSLSNKARPQCTLGSKSRSLLSSHPITFIKMLCLYQHGIFKNTSNILYYSVLREVQGVVLQKEKEIKK